MCGGDPSTHQSHSIQCRVFSTHVEVIPKEVEEKDNEELYSPHMWR